MRRNCKSCCFFESCDSRKVCDSYATIDDEIEDRDLSTWANQLRWEYRSAWLDYVDEWD